MKEVLPILTLVFFEGSIIPYLRDIFRGRTRPHRVTYFIWMLLGGLAFFASLEIGALDTIVVTGLVFFNCLFISLLSIKYGMPGFNRFDIFCLVGALVGFLMLFILHAPLEALVVTVITDCFALMPTLRKVFLHPESDHMGAWMIYSVGTIGNLMLIQSFTFENALYPMYMFIEGVLIIGFIIMGRIRQKDLKTK